MNGPDRRKLFRQFEEAILKAFDPDIFEYHGPHAFHPQQKETAREEAKESMKALGYEMQQGAEGSISLGPQKPMKGAQKKQVENYRITRGSKGIDHRELLYGAGPKPVAEATPGHGRTILGLGVDKRKGCIEWGNAELLSIKMRSVATPLYNIPYDKEIMELEMVAINVGGSYLVQYIMDGQGEGSFDMSAERTLRKLVNNMDRWEVRDAELDCIGHRFKADPQDLQIGLRKTWT